MSELAFQRQVDDIAKLRGWKKLALDVVQKRRATGTSRGWPDRVYFRKGRVVVLEMKAEKGGRLSDEQEAWLAAWQEFEATAPAHVHVGVVRPSDLEMVSGWLA